MTTVSLTANDHRFTLSAMLATPGFMPGVHNPLTSERIQEALRWALDQTQEPAPPPEGWSTSLPTPQTCISAIDMASQEPGRATLRDSLRWALPILRRAANLTQDGPIPRSDPEKPVGIPSFKSFPILTRWLDLCNASAEWVTIFQGNSPPQNVTPYDIVPTIDLKAEILAATGPNPDPEDRHLQTPLDVEPMTLENCLLSLRFLAYHPNIQSRHRRALKWVLDRLVKTPHPTPNESDPKIRSFVPRTPTTPFETLIALSDWLDQGQPAPKYSAEAVRWALAKIWPEDCHCDPPAPEAKIEITTREWIPALVALTKRELRFWREAGEVSGNVTRRAATRAIRGLEQILKTIPANLIQ